MVLMHDNQSVSRKQECQPWNLGTSKARTAKHIGTDIQLTWAGKFSTARFYAAMQLTYCKPIPRLIEDAKSQLQLYIGELTSTLEKAMSNSPRLAMKRCEQIKSQKLPFQTWKAICSRNGVYFSKTQKQYNWQQSFADIILLPFADCWDEAINSQLPQLIRQVERKVLEEFGALAHDLQAGIAPACSSNDNPLRAIFDQIVPLKRGITHQLFGVLRTREHYAQTIQDAAKKIVVIYLKQYTSRMSNEKGK